MDGKRSHFCKHIRKDCYTRFCQRSKLLQLIRQLFNRLTTGFFSRAALPFGNFRALLLSRLCRGHGKRQFIFAIHLKPADFSSQETSEVQRAPSVESDIVMNILLVEDSEDNRQLIDAFLKKTAHRLDMAVDGQQGVNRVKKRRYDLILMDMQMPVMDGYQATRAIRRWELDNALNPTPILALTAHALEGDAEKSIEAGCNEHLTKPIKKKRLLQKVAQYATA
ncbi:MAG: response regulator [Magnetococcales bacterium]|nr:response regulator [Magnetococcales bacterium]